MVKSKLCNCSSCHSWFNIEDIVIEERTILGVKTKEKRCPVCHTIGAGYTAEADEDWLNKKYL